MLDIEQAIREVGTVYQALTGRTIESGRSDLPPEIDPRSHIEGRYRQFKTIVESPAAAQAAPFAPAWAPPLEVIEREGEVRYELEVGAVSREQIGVSVVGAFLVVRGQRGGAADPAAAVRYSERPVGPFQRVVALPEGARRDGIAASLRDGVLVVSVPTDGPSGGEALVIEVG